ncbi:MAG TPA: undecaprenyldiphospho-muramoylpentapeptide beta-N-acetylglucosaminyltransferase [Bacillota bacterium]|nr:undecaprenyldiphospho-muramoylpentapeptide beta-N-acetylglucosaminyltransferase [Bacillota bacterium]
MKNRPKRLIFSGGGTGGHIFPALSVASAFVKRHPETEVLFVGAARGMEVQLVPKAGFALQTLDLAYLPRTLSLRQPVAVWKALLGVRHAAGILHGFSPDVVVGTGGYAAGPIVLRAALGGLPTLIHEQNAFPSLTNRILGRVVSRIAVSHEAALRHFPAGKAVVTGNPLRAEMLTVDRNTAREELGYGPDDFLLVVVGGSGGALGINRAVCQAYPALLSQRINIYHVAGKRDFPMVMAAAQEIGDNRLRVVDFAENMPDLWAAADLAVSRPGSTTSELAVMGVPAILIPSPIAANDHQTHNAQALVRAQAAIMLKESELNSATLAEHIIKLRRDQELRTRMSGSMLSLAKPDATDRVCDLIEGLMRP